MSWQLLFNKYLRNVSGKNGVYLLPDIKLSLRCDRYFLEKLLRRDDALEVMRGPQLAHDIPEFVHQCRFRK
jgi:hypothetical protein